MGSQVSKMSSKDVRHPLDSDEELLAQFESDWRRGQMPSIDDYLQRWTGVGASAANASRLSDAAGEHRRVLCELVMIDVWHRWQRKSVAAPQTLSSASIQPQKDPAAAEASRTAPLPARPLLDDYVRRFPSLGPVEELPLVLIREEFRARRSAGENIDHSEFAHRFGSRSDVHDAVQKLDVEISERAGHDSVAKATNSRELGAPLHCPFCQSDVAAERGARLQKLKCPTCGRMFSLLGDYLIIAKIGAGGMGEVYKAEHLRMRRTVALKVLPPKAMRSNELVQRFDREVPHGCPTQSSKHRHCLRRRPAAGIALSGDGIYRWHRSGKIRGPTWSIGRRIGHRMHCANRPRIGVRPLRRHYPSRYQARQFAGGPAGHGEDSRHGLGARGRTVVRTRCGPHSLTQSGQIMGTVDYMSPEQALDTRTVDARSDIYSLGCTLFRLLTGQPPYAGDTLMTKLLAHRNAEIPSLSAERADIPKQLDEVVRRMVAKKPEDRFPSMRELIASLEQCREGHSAAVCLTPDGSMANRKLQGVVQALRRGAPSGTTPGQHGSADESTIEGNLSADETTPATKLLGKLTKSARRNPKTTAVGAICGTAIIVAAGLFAESHRASTSSDAITSLATRKTKSSIEGTPDSNADYKTQSSSLNSAALNQHISAQTQGIHWRSRKRCCCRII